MYSNNGSESESIKLENGREGGNLARAMQLTIVHAQSSRTEKENEGLTSESACVWVIFSGQSEPERDCESKRLRFADRKAHSHGFGGDAIVKDAFVQAKH